MYYFSVLAEHKRSGELFVEYLEHFSVAYGIDLKAQRIANGLEFLNDYREKYDIIFIEVTQKDSENLKIAKQIRKLDHFVNIVLLLHSPDLAIYGYDIAAADCILAPFTSSALDRRMEILLMRVNAKRQQNTVVLHSEDTYFYLSPREIVYIESDKNYLIYHTEFDDYRVRGTFKNLASELYSYDFVPANRGVWVNKYYVKRVEPGQVFLSDIKQSTVDLSRRLAKGFRLSVFG